jgi:hypothetical protein
VRQRRVWGAERWLVAAAMVLAACRPALAQEVLLTLLEGDAVVIDGARRLAALPGLRLIAGDIVESGAATTLVRLEWPDESVVDLGPATRVMVLPQGFAKRGGQDPLVYLLQGWAKVISSSSLPAAGLVAPTLELLPLRGAAVLYADPHEQFVFAESGALDVLERPAGKSPLPLAPGALYTGHGSVLPRAATEWLQRVPRNFRDPIPRRAAALREHRVEASVLPPPDYAQLADWLNAEPELRRHFPRRFGALAQDPAFRHQLQVHLAAHPEWASVLNPPPSTQ